MSTWRYPSCDDVRKHQKDARDDARYGGHMNRPSPWDEPDCRRAYDDEYRHQESLNQQREEEERQEQQRMQRQQEAAAYARQQEEAQWNEHCRQEEERRYYESQQPQEEVQPTTAKETK